MNWQVYNDALQDWRRDYLLEYDVIQKMLIQLFPADLEKQTFWYNECTQTEVANAYAQKLMFT